MRPLRPLSLILRRCRIAVTLPVMKLTMSILVYLLIALVLSWGILGVFKGSYWLLAVSSIAYLLAFAWIGCREH